MPGSSIDKTQRKCVCVSVCGCEWCICDWPGEALYEYSGHRDVSSCQTEWWVCGLDLNGALCLFSFSFCCSVSYLMSLSLSNSLTHIHPSWLWQDYQTQASVQLDPLPSLPPNTTEKIANCISVSPTVLPTIICHPYFRKDTWFFNNACRANIKCDIYFLGELLIFSISFI